MSTTTTADVVGTPRDRVDGRLKVMGAATYPIDVNLPGLAHAALVQSTITSGRIRDIAVDAAERAPGVLAVITHLNAPALAHASATLRMGDPIGPQPLPPFQSDAVLHYGQHVAMVVAETREEANAAAALIDVTYERDTPVLSYDDPRASRVSHPWTPDYDRGDTAQALAAADVQVRTDLHDCRQHEQSDRPVRHRRGVGRRRAHRPRHDAASTWRARQAGSRVRRRSGRRARAGAVRGWCVRRRAARVAACATRGPCRAGHEAACEACADACPDVHHCRPSAQHHSGVGTRRDSRRTAHGPRTCLDIVAWRWKTS